MASEQILSIIIDVLIFSNPVLGALNLALPTFTGGLTQVLLADQSLSLANFTQAVGNTLTSPFVSAWDWLVYNVISPLLMLLYLVLFFVGQYYLFRLYVFFGKNFYKTIIELFGTFQNTKAYNDIVDTYKKAFPK